MLQEMVGGGKGSKERRRRAHILLQADEDRQGGVGTATVERVRRQCTMEGLEATLERKIQMNRKPRLLDGKAEAKLTMLAYSEPPEGHARWSLKLLGDRLVELEIVEEIAGETVRRAPKETTSSPG